GGDWVREGIEPYDVGGSERGALRPADERAGQGIHDVEADAEPLRVMYVREQREHAHAVGDEVGCVLGADHALAERGDEELLEVVEYRAFRGCSRNELDEMHVARRVEEMHAAEPSAETLRAGLRQLVDTEPRGIAREYRVLADVGRHFPVQVGLPVQPLGDGLDDEVALLQPLEVLVVVRRFYERGSR